MLTHAKHTFTHRRTTHARTHTHTHTHIRRQTDADRHTHTRKPEVCDVLEQSTDLATCVYVGALISIVETA